MLNIIMGLFKLVLSIILAGCQLIGSAILFTVLFIVFILLGFVTTVFLLEHLKTPYTIFGADDKYKIIVGNGKDYEVQTYEKIRDNGIHRRS